MLQFVSEQAKASGFDDIRIAKIELATEEALVNVISYAYTESSHSEAEQVASSDASNMAYHPTPAGEVLIECTNFDDKGLKIVIKDQGTPYNPLTERKVPDLTAPIEERSLGGLGIYFFTQIMDQVSYNREPDANVLTLIKFK